MSFLSEISRTLGVPMRDLLRPRKLGESQLVARTVPLTTAWDVVRWWEVRRPLFNVAVGFAGVVTCVVCFGVGIVSELLIGIPVGIPDPPIFAIAAIVLFGIMANVCYTAGWVAELFIRTAWPEDSDRFATLSFALGTAFLIGLTLLPIPLVVAGALLSMWFPPVGLGADP